jgi:hypothetical protein
VIDSAAYLLGFLTSQTSLIAKTSTRLWPRQSEPLPGYKPSDGPGIAFKTRGGTADYARAFLDQSWQFKVYGLTEDIAEDTYRTLVDVLDEVQSGDLRWAALEMTGQTLTEQNPPWIYVLCYFETKMVYHPA